MKNILNKIAQMERNAEEIQLASHKVQLGALDDIIAAEQAPKPFMDKAIALKKEALNNFVEAQRNYKLVVDLCDKYLPMAKELGEANAIKTLTNKRKMANDMFKALNIDISKLK